MANIYIYDEFNPEDTAMMQALYSRSPKSVVEHVKKVKSSGSGEFMKTLLNNTNEILNAILTVNLRNQKNNETQTFENSLNRNNFHSFKVLLSFMSIDKIINIILSTEITNNIITIESIIYKLQLNITK